MRFYEVGGAVRDELMGLQSSDIDYAVEARSFEELQEVLKDMGFEFYLVKPEFFTIKAKAPKGSKFGLKHDVVDFVLCRKDGSYVDGRRPEEVYAGTILDDLARRDFTVNAIARDMETRKLIDPHGGAQDIKTGILRFVGDPMTRIKEDGLRVLRALRFWVTKELVLDPETYKAIKSREAVEMVYTLPIERIREEIQKMFNHSTVLSLRALELMPTILLGAIFRDGIRLEPTLKKV